MATARVDVPPEMLEWAIERSGQDPDELYDKFSWLAEGRPPTVRQLEGFARTTHTPVGFMFLPEPPEEILPVTDFRTIGNQQVRRPSPDLLDTLYLCEQRQDWFRDYAEQRGTDPVPFIGTATLADDPADAASWIREVLGFEFETRGRFRNWTEALRSLIDLVESTGVLVMVSGIVGSNTHRTLDPDEFRGLALSDSRAPLIFVNGRDSKAAQIFTIVHEFAHLWLGSSGVDRPTLDALAGSENVEQWCNAVAAEVLVPLATLPDRLDLTNLTAALEDLARRYKVSTLVILRRFVDAGHLTWEQFRPAWDAELERVIALSTARAGAGGDFYNTQPLRVSRRFARALITSTLEGGTAHRDAFRLLGVRRFETFQEFGETVGVA